MYTAKDGKKFINSYQGRSYNDSLAERGKRSAEEAPGGPAHEQSLREHGFIRELRIVREGNGRHRVTATHNDGATFTQVHPDGYRAHAIAGRLLQLPETPSFEVHQRARSQPHGQPEERRVAREDRRSAEPVIPGIHPDEEE